MDDFGGPEYDYDSPSDDDSDPDTFGDEKYEPSTPSSTDEEDMDTDTFGDENYEPNTPSSVEEDMNNAMSPEAKIEATEEEKKQFNELAALGDYFVVYFFERKYTREDDDDADAIISELADNLNGRLPVIAVNNKAIPSFIDEVVHCFMLFKGETTIHRVEGPKDANEIAGEIRGQEGWNQFKELSASGGCFVVYFSGKQYTKKNDAAATTTLAELTDKLSGKLPVIAVDKEAIGPLANDGCPCFILFKGENFIHQVETAGDKVTNKIAEKIIAAAGL